MKSSGKYFKKTSLRWPATKPTFRSLVLPGIIALIFTASSHTWAQQSDQEASQAPAQQLEPPSAWLGGQQDNQEQPEQPASISGTVVDPSSSPVAGAVVMLTCEGRYPKRETVAGDDGQFSFDAVAPGAFEITVTAPGFAAQTLTGIVHSQENLVAPQIQLAIAENITSVKVMPRDEIAATQIAAQEKQRVLAIVPNFYASYAPDAVPLNAKQKFHLAWKTMIDPFTFGLTAAVAGVQQKNDDFSGFGQGTEGYAKRFGAFYADTASAMFIGSGILPTVLKQDPRYFYKGTGSKFSRAMYAIANSVICKGDNGHWQPNYSYVLGSLAAGGISNLYYPPGDRSAVSVAFENTAIDIAETAILDVFQEFLIRKLTPGAKNQTPPNGTTGNNP